MISRSVWKYICIGCALSACSSEASSFVCTTNADCVRSGEEGLCVAAGACVFADTTCAAGWRVDESAGVNAASCLYGEGFDDVNWIPPADRAAALRAGDEALRELPVPLTSPMPVDAAVVLYTRAKYGFDPAGIYVQSVADGRAWFMAIDPTTLSPQPVPGNVIRFVATETEVVFDQRIIAAIEPTSYRMYDGWVVDLEPYVVTFPESGRVDQLAFLNENESRLLRARITTRSSDPAYAVPTWLTAGPGHYYLSIDVPTLWDEANNEPVKFEEVELRFPTEIAREVVTAHDLREGCTVELGPVPVFRWTTFLELNVLNPETELRIIGCEAAAPRAPLAITEVMLSDDPDSEATEMWFEVLATERVDLASCQILAGNDDTPIPLTAAPRVVEAGQRVVIVDRTMPAMPASWTAGGQTITPTYVEVAGLAGIYNQSLGNYCGDYALRLACGGRVVDRFGAAGCEPAPPQVASTTIPGTMETADYVTAYGVQPSHEGEVSPSFVSFCPQTHRFSAGSGGREFVMTGTPGAPNDGSCY